MAEPHDAPTVPRETELLARLPLLRAWRTLRAADPKFPDRSFVVEFAGMPKAGKSTSIEGIRHFFSHGYKTEQWNDAEEWMDLHYKVHTPAEGVSLRTPARLKRSSTDFNTWAGAYALQELLQAAHDGYNDLVILDRGPWDASCWLEYYSDTSEQPSELKEVAAFFRRSSWMTRSDVHVVLLVDPAEAAVRERRDRLFGHGGASSNTALMTKMYGIYSKRFPELQTLKTAECTYVGEHSAILIDTTKLETKQGIKVVINAILDVLAAKVRHAAADLPVVSKSFVIGRLDRYWARMGRDARDAAEAYLESTFAPAVNQLEPWQQLAIIKRIEDMALPEALAQTRIPSGAVVQSLEDVVRRVRALKRE
jgi:hypothetical protein